jgi:hypothetical protein
MRLPSSPSAWTMAVFGVMSLISGIVGLVWPDALLSALGFQMVDAGQRAAGDYTRVFMASSSMAALNMGVYYLIAASAGWLAFFRATVAFRLLTCTVFSSLVATDVAPLRFLGVALWEGIGALVTGAALWLETRRPAGERAGSLSAPN